MSESSLRSKPSLGGISLAALLSGVIVLASLLSMAPAWHEQLHPDAATTTHLCAVTLFGGGHCEAHLDVPTTVTPDAPGLLATLILRDSPARVRPHFFARLEHAPPTFV